MLIENYSQDSEKLLNDLKALLKSDEIIFTQGFWIDVEWILDEETSIQD